MEFDIRKVRNHLFVVSVLLYVAFCIPAYLILEGPVEGVASIPPQVAIGGLIVGAIVIIPMIHAVLEKYTEVYTVRQTLQDIANAEAEES